MSYVVAHGADGSQCRSRSVTRIGVPLWQYGADIDLLEALNSVATTLGHLAALGIVHRDISPQNVLLGQGVAKGLLVDLDFALVHNHRQSTLPDDRSSSPAAAANAERHAIRNTLCENHGRYPLRMTSLMGTLHFAPSSVLKAERDKRTVLCSPEHDVESLCWVVGYIMLRMLIKKLPVPQTTSAQTPVTELYSNLQRVLHTPFGAADLKQLLEGRREQSATPFEWIWLEVAVTDLLIRNTGDALYALLQAMTDPFTTPRYRGVADRRRLEIMQAMQRGETIPCWEEVPLVTLVDLKAMLHVALAGERA